MVESVTEGELGDTLAGESLVDVDTLSAGKREVLAAGALHELLAIEARVVGRRDLLDLQAGVDAHDLDVGLVVAEGAGDDEEVLGVGEVEGADLDALAETHGADVVVLGEGEDVEERLSALGLLA